MLRICGIHLVCFTLCTEIKEDLGDDVNEKAVVEKDELQTKLNELKSDLEYVYSWLLYFVRSRQ